MEFSWCPKSSIHALNHKFQSKYDPNEPLYRSNWELGTVVECKHQQWSINNNLKVKMVKMPKDHVRIEIQLVLCPLCALHWMVGPHSVINENKMRNGARGFTHWFYDYLLHSIHWTTKWHSFSMENGRKTRQEMRKIKEKV